MRDTIEIHDLQVPTRIGVTKEERATPQDLFLDVTLHTDTRKAGETDDLADTIDYQALSDEIRSLASVSEYNLLEKLAEEVSRICIENYSASFATIRIKKPDALQNARTTAVFIQRDIADYPPTSPS